MHTYCMHNSTSALSRTDLLRVHIYHRYIHRCSLLHTRSTSCIYNTNIQLYEYIYSILYIYYFQLGTKIRHTNFWIDSKLIFPVQILLLDLSLFSFHPCIQYIYVGKRSCGLRKKPRLTKIVLFLKLRFVGTFIAYYTNASSSD